MCTACVHLAWAQMARKSFEQTHKWTESDFRQAHRHDTELRPQGQHNVAEPTDVASDLEYGNQMSPIEVSDLSQSDDSQWELLGNNLNYENNQLQRVKRHAGHSHAEEKHVEMNRNTEQYIEKIFKQFSNSDHEMNLVEFEKMMRQLGLDRIIENKQLNNAIHPEESSRGADSHANHSHDVHSNGTVSDHFKHKN